jgi:hypothetical protein
MSSIAKLGNGRQKPAPSYSIGTYFRPGTVIIGGKGHEKRPPAALFQPSFCFDSATGSILADRGALGPGGTRGANRAAKIKAELRLVCC